MSESDSQRTLSFISPKKPLPRRGGKGYLVALQGDEIGRTHELGVQLVIGRSRSADLRIQDESLSRQHARLYERGDGHYTIEDLDSRNGTWVNGERITSHELRDGDRIQIGRHLWKFAWRDELDAQLRDAQRMEAIGSLAAGVAHDFNNLLVVIEGGITYLQMLADSGDISMPEDASNTLDDMLTAAERASGLTRQLLGFARRGQFEQRPVNASEVMAEAVRLASRTFDRLIEIESDIEPGLEVLGDRSQVQQMLLNLCVNARDAMPSGGKLCVSVHLVELDASQTAALASHLEAGAYVKMSVTDDGVGMDESTQARAFEPFASTKGIGRGLGLATVYQIARGHSGVAVVDSQLGEGTTFTIYLPELSGQTPVPRPLVSTKSPMPPGRGTVLLVDDEPAVRKVVTKLLERLGFDVIQATNGREALERFQEHRDQVTLVLLDLIMPEMGGAEAFGKLRELDPGVKVLISSGYDDGQAQGVLEAGADGFLHKPFRFSELQAAVVGALGILDTAT